MPNRRQFVKSAAAVGAAFHIVPRHVLGRGFTAPSDTVRLAAIGIGGKGESDITGIVRAGASVAALCDVDWRAGAKSFGRFPDARRFKDFREMFDTMANDIDAVSVSTPDHTHAVATIAALRLGKPVFCQKPLTRTLGEVRKVMAEAQRTGLATQMGNQGHAGEGTRVISEWYEAGAIGEIREIHYWSNRPIWPQGIDRPTEAHNPHPTFDWNLWLGPAPERPYNPAYAPFRWRGWWDFGTGALGDIACHAMDAAFWTLDLGFPSRIAAESTGLYREAAPKASRIEYDFPAKGTRPAVKVLWRDGGILPPRPPQVAADAKWPPSMEGGQLWIGDAGALVAGIYGQNPRLLDEKRQAEVTATPLPVTYPRTEGVYKEWIAAAKAGGQPGSNFAGHSGPLTEMVLLGNLAVRLARPIELDPATGAVRSPEVPAELITPAYREGWR